MLNKYIELHEQFVELLVRYHALHTRWLKSQSQDTTRELRRVLSELRKHEREQWLNEQATMKEISRQKREKKKLKKEKLNERNSSSN